MGKKLKWVITILVCASVQISAPELRASSGTLTISGESNLRIAAHPGDANFDGVVNSSDLNILTKNFGRYGNGPAFGDFNSDGLIDSTDFGIYAGAVLNPGGGTSVGVRAGGTGVETDASTPPPQPVRASASRARITTGNKDG